MMVNALMMRFERIGEADGSLGTINVLISFDVGVANGLNVGC